MININKKIYILIGVFFVIISIVFFVIQPKSESLEADPGVKYITSKSGIPLIGSSKYTDEGWDKITELESLNNLISEQNGGSLGRVSYIHGIKSTIYPIYYLKAEVFSEYENTYLYFKYDNGWSKISKKDIPDYELSLIDEKLKEDEGE